MKNDIAEKQLLVIDDEIDITRSIFRQFRRKYKVLTATSGDEALRIMEKERIQVVLSDQRMPGMTGTDFFGIIKDKYPDALKLLLTGYADIEAVVGAINEGQVFRYLTKPWNPIELDLAIKDAFEKHALITNNKHLMTALKEANITLEDKVKQRTHELEQANTRLKQLNLEKNKYVGIVAHDLRNPIGNAYNYSDLLISDFKGFSEAEKLKFLQIINERCSYSLKLIEGFLDTSKIESGILDLHLQECDYRQILEDCIAQNELFAKNKSQKITLVYSRSDQVSCDKDKIMQVLNNLISNAIKYSDVGKEIVIRVWLEANQLHTVVKDEGHGIPNEELKLLFQAFRTTSTSAKTKEKSTGLGLAIVKKIVEAHNGHVSVKSEVGKGSEFSFSVPISKTP